ncbi:putative membrane protein [Ehrlichia japonica]|uniref:Putative membrane protein n=1 Tax=Ehrlichia japonica TaxID=391036 RepID=X5GC54_9RICK|nr:putative membrane protein [Ehrlichia japonica]
MSYPITVLFHDTNMYILLRLLIIPYIHNGVVGFVLIFMMW